MPSHAVPNPPQIEVSGAIGGSWCVYNLSSTLRDVEIGWRDLIGSHPAPTRPCLGFSDRSGRLEMKPTFFSFFNNLGESWAKGREESAHWVFFFLSYMSSTRGAVVVWGMPPALRGLQHHGGGLLWRWQVVAWVCCCGKVPTWEAASLLPLTLEWEDLATPGQEAESGLMKIICFMLFWMSAAKRNR